MTGAAQHLSLLARLALPGSARHLALLRIAIGAHLTTVFASPVYALLAPVAPAPHPMTATWFPGALEGLVGAHIEALALLGLALSALLMIGAAVRVVAPALFVVFVATQGWWFRATLFHDDWLYFAFPLLALSFARAGDAWSIDALVRRPPRDVDRRAYRWPVEAVVAWLAFTYTSAGLAKVFPLVKGAVWITGISAQEFAMQFARESPLFWVLGRTPFDYDARWPFTVGAIGTVVVELGAASLLFTHRGRLPLFGALLAMHASIWLLGIPAFPQMLLALAVASIPPDRFADGVDEPRDDDADTVSA